MTRKAARLFVLVAIALLVLIAATAFLVNLYRDSIALEVARTALRDSEIQVADVSVAFISSNEVRFDAIILELADGARIFIEGVTLPVRFRGLQGSTLHVEAVRFEPGAADDRPVRIAEGLQNFLDAPAATPGATIRIDQVLLPGLPVISNAAWHADPLNPTLRATVGTFELFLTTTRENDGTYRGAARALMPDDTEALMLGFQLAPGESGFQVRGNMNVMLEPLLPVLRAAGAVPADVKELVSVLAGAFELGLEADATLPVRIQAKFESASGTTMVYRADDTDVELSVIETSPVDALFEYPSLQWSAQLASASIKIRGVGLDLPPVRLRNAECHSGIRCRAAVEVSYGDLALGGLTITGATASAAAVEFVSDGEKWEASAPNTKFALKSPAIRGRRIITPSVQADLSGSNDRLFAKVTFTAPQGGLSGRAVLSHDVGAAAGKLALESAAIDFSTVSLSKVFIDWPYDWDISAGHGTAQAAMRWTGQDKNFVYEGTAAVTADSLAGRYADIGFLGFDTRLDIELDSTRQVAVKPARFDVALVDVGFPVEDISGTATPYIDESSVEVGSLTMTVLGGTVTADPFRYNVDAERNQLNLHARNIQLPLMAGLADLEAVTISGSVSGDIPVTIRGNKVIIDGGHLENDPPGGVIQYRGGAAGGIVDDSSQLGIVTRTLRNLEFDSLTSAVNYSEDGDLVLKMRLKGINPDVDPTQPVILNLNVENNVPQMLRSLQATRSIEDVLERKLSK